MWTTPRSGDLQLWARRNPTAVAAVLLIGFLVFFFVALAPSRDGPLSDIGGGVGESGQDGSGSSGESGEAATTYATATSAAQRYRHQVAYNQYSARSDEYHVAIVTDKDVSSWRESKEDWHAVLRTGRLSRGTDGSYSVQWESADITLASKLNEDGRAMELSELVQFGGALYTMDDRTGVVSEVDSTAAALVPRFILMDGSGVSSKGFKCEWSTVKDGKMYVGSMGKEWVRDGVVISQNPMWVKSIDAAGRIEHHDWSAVYNALRKAAGFQHPGYMLHEAVAWNPVQRRWYFLPRRASREPYDEAKDEERGTNLLLSVNEYFQDVQIANVGPLIKTHGFSSVKFIPWRETEFVALKTEEFRGQIATYITVMNLNGDILLPEQLISHDKFEGIEFV